MRIIDCHVHPQPLADYDQGIQRLLKAMRSHGIERFIASDLCDVWVAFPEAGSVARANERLQKAAQDSNGEIQYLVYLNPQQENWQSELEKHRCTACGIKLWISLSTPENGFARTIDVLHEAARINLPVLIHTFERTDGVVPGAAGVEEIIMLAQAAPETVIVAAHSCGSWRKAIKNAARFPQNIYFDVSGCYPERNMVKRLTEAFGADRILYGSDAYGRSFGSQLAKVLYAELPPDDMDKILYRNAVKIFHLPEHAPAMPLDRPRWDVPEEAGDYYCFAGKCDYFDHSAELAELVEQAADNGYTALYAPDLSALHAADRVEANRAYAQKAAAYPAVKPLALVNPAAPEALKQLENMENLAGIFISPYLENYPLDYDSARDFFDLCAARQIPVFINTAVSDDRFRSRKLNSHPVSNQEIADFIAQAPENQYIFQGAAHYLSAAETLPKWCYWECSRLSDGEYAMENLMQSKPHLLKQLRYGSEYPFRNYATTKAIMHGLI